MRLKALDTFGNCQRPVFSLGVSQYMHHMVIQLQENNERRSCCITVCAFRCLYKGFSPDVLCYLSARTCFSKTTLLQWEVFLTICYTVNSSPLLVTK